MQAIDRAAIRAEQRAILLRAGIGIATVVVIGSFIGVIMGPPEIFQGRASGPFAVADIERAFEDPATAFARYGRGPILVDGQIASVHADRVTLDSIYLLNVQAHFKGSTGSVALGPARLRCDRLEQDTYPTGAKPALAGCRLDAQ